MPSICIRRPKEWMNRLRRYELYLDGKSAGKIKNDDIQEFQVPPGEHTLHARVDWCGSKDYRFNIAEGETKYLKISGFRHSNWIMPLGLITVLAEVALRRMIGSTLSLLLLLPFGLILLYYFTIGRKSYLLLREDELR